MVQGVLKIDLKRMMFVIISAPIVGQFLIPFGAPALAGVEGKSGFVTKCDHSRLWVGCLVFRVRARDALHDLNIVWSLRRTGMPV